MNIAVATLEHEIKLRKQWIDELEVNTEQHYAEVTANNSNIELFTKELEELQSTLEDLHNYRVLKNS